MIVFCHTCTRTESAHVMTLQKILGHQATTMTMRYAHLSTDHLAEAIEFAKKERETCQATSGRFRKNTERVLRGNDAKSSMGMVPAVGLEPTHCLQRRILNPLRLPIPPRRQRVRIIRVSPGSSIAGPDLIAHVDYHGAPLRAAPAGESVFAYRSALRRQVLTVIVLLLSRAFTQPCSAPTSTSISPTS